MKKLGFVLLLISVGAIGQELDSLAADSIEKVPPAYYLGIYFNGSVVQEPSTPNRNILGSYAIGIQYEGWLLEASLTNQLGAYDAFLIFPNVFSFKYRYAGVQIAYNFLERRNVNMHAGLGYFSGAMLWEYKETGVIFLRDVFGMYKVFARLEYDRFRFFKPYLGVGYQKAVDVDLTNVAERDFSGINIRVGVRIGFFNQ